jgi:hypothetical protein
MLRLGYALQQQALQQNDYPKVQQQPQILSGSGYYATLIVVWRI